MPPQEDSMSERIDMNDVQDILSAAKSAIEDHTSKLGEAAIHGTDLEWAVALLQMVRLQSRYITTLETENVNLRERYSAYIDEYVRVVKTANISNDILYDAGHNATIIVQSVLRKQYPQLGSK